MDKYSIGVICLNSKFCRILSGRTLRFQSVVSPTSHIVRWLEPNSPLLNLAIMESHRRLHCGLGIQNYTDGVVLAGCSTNNLKSLVEEYIHSCTNCTSVKMVFSAKSPLNKKIRLLGLMIFYMQPCNQTRFKSYSAMKPGSFQYIQIITTLQYMYYCVLSISHIECI